MIQKSDESAHVTHIRARTSFFDIGLADLWRFRDLFVTISTRDLKVRYKQTAIGVAWVVLQPLITSLVLVFVFSKLAGLPTDGISPLLFAFSGMLGFNAFAQTLTRSGNTFVANRGLVSKVFFPRLILPLSPMLSAGLDFLVGLIVLVPMMLWFRVMPTAAIFTLPIWLGFIVLFSLGVGIIASSLMVFYRDVAFLIPLLNQVLLYITPAGFSLQGKPDSLITRVAYLNPLSGLTEAFRWSILGTTYVNWSAVWYGVGVAVVLFIFSLFFFARLEEKFADVI